MTNKCLLILAFFNVTTLKVLFYIFTQATFKRKNMLPFYSCFIDTDRHILWVSAHLLLI